MKLQKKCFLVIAEVIYNQQPRLFNIVRKLDET